jgi:hypothetical protein
MCTHTGVCCLRLINNKQITIFTSHEVISTSYTHAYTHILYLVNYIVIVYGVCVIDREII